jgi:hypothetical protein
LPQGQHAHVDASHEVVPTVHWRAWQP